jgi:hypothetical protein
MYRLMLLHHLAQAERLEAQRNGHIAISLAPRPVIRNPVMRSVASILMRLWGDRRGRPRWPRGWSVV